MRVASMVPSWTETLIAAGANVVARTRFCIHPISNIAAVGGTKDISREKLAATSAELLVLDKEENPLPMAEASPIPYWASHVTSVHAMPASLRELAAVFAKAGETHVEKNLEGFALRWETVITKLSQRAHAESIPAIKDWICKPAGRPETILYLIWKNPYMVAGRDTFIGSMLELLGVKLEIFDRKYPELDLQNYDPAKTLLLFSSEPYPFEKHVDEIRKMPFASAIIDGESLSWFGIRSLKFLESQK